MAEKPQQQTLSVRISDTLRRRLERARQLSASKSGEPVSTSEIAKQLLESARDDRLEVVELLSAPTDTLLRIRRKGIEDVRLSRAEWAVIAHFAHQGIEAFATTTPNRVSVEALTSVLDAFVAVYDLRANAESSRDVYYLGNLPPECRPTSGKRTERSETASPDIVRRTIAETKRRLADPGTTFFPMFAARNLYVLLEEDKLPGAELIDRALRPYWPVLWRLAARGHYVATEQPVREREISRDGFNQPPIPSISEGGYSLAFSRGEGHDFSVLLSFPGEVAPMYPISEFPRLTEFCAMLAKLGPTGQPRWHGRFFLGYLGPTADRGERSVWFRAHDNGITFGFTAKQWSTVQALFRRAWDLPDVQSAWQALTDDYGEL